MTGKWARGSLKYWGGSKTFASKSPELGRLVVIVMGSTAPLGC